MYEVYGVINFMLLLASLYFGVATNVTDSLHCSPSPSGTCSAPGGPCWLSTQSKGLQREGGPSTMGTTPII